MDRHQQRQYLFERENARKYVSGRYYHDDENVLGHAMILSFEDLEYQNWYKERQKLEEAFNSIQCSVITLDMDSSAFKKTLKRFVDKRFEKPRIIFIPGCHGGDLELGLRMSSRLRSTFNGTRWWCDIVKIVAPAQVDVLFIVHCCHVGNARISRQGSGIKYAKEVIALSGWHPIGWRDVLIDPLTAGIKCWFADAMTTQLTSQKLYEYISASMRHTREAIAPQEERASYTQLVYSQEHDNLESKAIESSNDGKVGSVEKAREWKLAMPRLDHPVQRTQAQKDLYSYYSKLRLGLKYGDDSDENSLEDSLEKVTETKPSSLNVAEAENARHPPETYRVGTRQIIRMGRVGQWDRLERLVGHGHGAKVD